MACFFSSPSLCLLHAELMKITWVSDPAWGGGERVTVEIKEHLPVPPQSRFFIQHRNKV